MRGTSRRLGVLLARVLVASLTLAVPRAANAIPVLITWIMLTAVVALSATPAVAQQPLEASLTFVSETGDYIGAGQSASYRLDTASFTLQSSGNGGHVGLTILGFNGDWWYLDLSAPAGTQLVTGAYEGAVRYPFQDVNQPGLSFSGNGRGCNTLTGRFDVHEASFGSNGDVRRFHATFEQHCEGGEPALHGEVLMVNPVLDQQQSVVDVSVGGLGLGGGSEQKLAQVITVGISGELSAVAFPVGCAAGSLVLEIQRVTNGVPNGAVLASETVWGANFAGTSAFKTVVLSQRPFLIAGETIALVLSSTGECGIFQGPEGNSYLGGDGFFDARPNLPGWLFLSDGRRDLPFQTFVEPRPVANADAYAAGFGTPLSVTAPGVLANDAVNGGGTLSAVLVAGPSHGSVNLSANGSFTYAPASGYNGVDAFSYRTSNDLGQSNVALVSITVAAPSAPVAVSDAFTTAFATALEVPPPGLLSNDSSPVGAPMVTVLESGVTHGALVLRPDGGFSYTPDAGYAGTDQFTYRASNAGGASNVATVALTVSNTTVVQPPAKLYASSIVGNTVTLRFKAPAAGPQPTGYVLRGGLLPGEELASLPTGSTFPIYTFAAPKGAFYIRMHSLNGGEVSTASNEIRIFVDVPATPSAPASLTGTVNGNTLALTWLDTFGGGTPEAHLLDVTGTLATTLPLPAGETFSFTGVPPGTYTLSLRSANAAGVSPSSNPVTLTFPDACSGAPQPPSNFLAYRVGNTVTVLWEPPTVGTAATSYELLVGDALDLTVPTAFRTLQGTVPPGTYNLSVRAVNACGSGAYTAVQTIVVP